MYNMGFSYYLNQNFENTDFSEDMQNRLGSENYRKWFSFYITDYKKSKRLDFTPLSI